jgi:hypothetical protein
MLAYRATVLTLSALLVTVIVAPARAFDATGTWLGKWSCKDFDGKKFSEGNPESTLQISQNDDVLAIDLDGGSYRYNGRSLNDAAKPEKGEAVFASCAIDNQPFVGGLSEIIRVAIKTKPGALKATLKGQSIFENGASVGNCKYTFKRVSDQNPNVSDCPA